ncbi:Uncharacterised protein [uncultured Clostridium sp.]|nr:Uncharacterised protein [uncultured Clostridium sp.]
MKNAGKARSYGLYRHLRTSKEIIENLLNYYCKNCCPYYYFSPLGIGSDEVSGRILHSHSNLQNSY